MSININSHDVFALVHLDYEGLQILELGHKNFILEKYSWWKEQFEFASEGTNQGDASENLCIMGYVEKEVACVCNNFDVSISKVEGL